MYMVEKIMLTNGTVNSIIFNKVSNPLALLSSKLNTLHDKIVSSMA